MKLQIAKPPLTGIVDYFNDKEQVNVDGIYYDLVYNLPDIVTLYSLPVNDKHKPYTKRSKLDISKAYSKDAIRKFWSPFKKGDTVQGFIQDSKFMVI